MTQKEIKDDHRRLHTNLLLCQKVLGRIALCEAIGVTPSTWTTRMKEPWKKFSYDDFRLIAKASGIEVETLLFGTVTLYGNSP